MVNVCDCFRLPSGGFQRFQRSQDALDEAKKQRDIPGEALSLEPQHEMPGLRHNKSVQGGSLPILQNVRRKAQSTLGNLGSCIGATN